ncbi:hypothetical protein KY342_03475 [Candidatus Woesearchaeota archaeon]|nr:hypothetical protein [Candidatus Woesearchaeota archaeon]
MKLSELHKIIQELDLKPLDTVRFYEHKTSFPAVLAPPISPQFGEGLSLNFKSGRVDYIFLNGVSIHYSAEKGTDPETSLSRLERWEPSLEDEIEAVRKIREDIMNNIKRHKGYKYIR